MIDLISHGIHHGIRNGREIIEIPSVSFSHKCAETLKAWDRSTQGPLPPP